MQKMRILMVIDSLTSGGAQRQMVTLATGLAARGHLVELFIYHPKTHFAPTLEAAGIQIHIKHKKGRFSVVADLRKLLKAHSYDAVLSFLHGPNLYSELACLFRKKPKLIVSERGTYSHGFQNKMKYLFQMHRLSDHLTINSHAQAQEIKEQAPWLKHKITTIYNGLDLNRFSPSKRRSTKTNGAIRLLSVGFVAPRKNPLTLIRALKLYLDKANARPLSIAWAGRVCPLPLCQNIYEEAVELIESLQLGDHWEWLGEQDDMPALYPQYDGLIHPSFREGLSNAIAEAMACGLPILASNVYEHPRLIEEGKSGFLFNPNSAETIANTLQAFTALSTEKHHEMGAAARHFAESNLATEKFITNYESLFYRLSGKQSGSGH